MKFGTTRFAGNLLLPSVQPLRVCPAFGRCDQA